MQHPSSSNVYLQNPQTTATLVMFTLVMVGNQHVWKHTQAEIDAIMGMERLPEFDDRLSLPYIDAIIREVARWRPVFPLGACQMSVLYNVIQIILKVARTRLCEAIFTRVTTYPMVCPMLTCGLFVIQHSA
ncbi:hypothetical protein JVT61DRAFT_15489 [Boletus reticuloceps]|uniref:Cytochrome P450 n=1 Tax=Boletus reticuloceps TaxID=495285 RepID=A0A8I2YCF9_9AGAM|nr:hypothetical protein JVT61DRAFT_15489 [Boletus reticuloceps]